MTAVDVRQLGADGFHRRGQTRTFVCDAVVTRGCLAQAGNNADDDLSLTGGPAGQCLCQMEKAVDGRMLSAIQLFEAARLAAARTVRPKMNDRVRSGFPQRIHEETV